MWAVEQIQVCSKVIKPAHSWGAYEESQQQDVANVEAPKVCVDLNGTIESTKISATTKAMKEGKVEIRLKNKT